MNKNYLGRFGLSVCAFFIGCSMMGAESDTVFSVDNLKYKVVGDAVVDVVGYDVAPSGELIVPESVSYDGCQYQVRMVGEEAFADCDQITSAKISATEIDNGAFVRCYSLTTLELNTDMTRIGDNAFEACRSLTDFIYPGCIEEIGANAFVQCMSLTTAYLPSSMQTLGSGAYSFCQSLKEVLFNHGIKAVPEEAFCGCTLLTDIDFGDVQTIGTRAFAECESLASVVIGDAVTAIADEAFNDCSGLKTLVLGSAVESIGDEAFASSRSLSSIESRNTTPPEVGYRAFRRVDKETCCVYVPAEAMEAYQGWGDFEKILPIGGSAGLEVGDVFTVDDGYTYRVTEVDKSVTITYFDDMIDGWEEYDWTLDIPSEVTYNGVTFTVTSIGYRAITQQWHYDVFNIPSTVKTIEAYAFSNNRFTTHINLPEGLEYIGASAFEGCETLAEITIPSTVSEIGDGAFMLCQSLKEVVVPDNVTRLGVMAFEFCYGLEQITFGSGVETIPAETCSKCSSLKTIDFSEAIRAIDHDAFDNCSALVNLSFPEGMETIGFWAFAECENIEKIEFPSTLQEIDDAAFFDTSALLEVTCYGKVPAEVDEDAFLDSNANAVVYVPAESLEQYSSIQWGGFTDFRRLDEKSGVTTVATNSSKTAVVGNELHLGNSGANVVVADLLGRVLYQGIANGSTVQLNSESIIIVKEGDKASKYILSGK
jgi:hypothetical protein